MAAVLDNNSIRIPTGLKVSIFYNNCRNNWEAVEIVDDESNKFLALFECDNVDFKIRIDNRESNGGHGFTIKTCSMERDFYVDANRLWELETLESGGGKLHFVSQKSTAGRQLVDIAVKEMEKLHIDASTEISRMEFQFEAERAASLKEVIRIYVRTDEDKTLDLDVKTFGTIADVKLMIFRLERISPDNQRLTFAGEELEDRRTIADYKQISEYATFLLKSRKVGNQLLSGQNDSFRCTGRGRLVIPDRNEGRGRAIGRSRGRAIGRAAPCLSLDTSRPGIPASAAVPMGGTVSVGHGSTSAPSDRPTGIPRSVQQPPVPNSTGEILDVTTCATPTGATPGNAERGVVCFGEKSDQAFNVCSFTADKSIEIKPIIIEFQIKTNLKLRC